MTNPSDFLPPDSNQPAANGSGGCSRRGVIKAAAAVLVALPGGLPQALAAAPQDQRPQPGDRLALASAEGTPVPLTLADIKLGEKPVQAFPLDAAAGTLRDGSRFNKVLLVRLEPAAMDAETLARSADGVLAFSAVCTHEGCDVTEWLPKENALLCFCHFSKFSPLAAGHVLSGPAPRNLPCLPLALNKNELAVAGSFSAPPGAKKAG
jgi:rieske iron-sulfur protein